MSCDVMCRILVMLESEFWNEHPNRFIRAVEDDNALLDIRICLAWCHYDSAHAALLSDIHRRSCLQIAPHHRHKFLVY